MATRRTQNRSLRNAGRGIIGDSGSARGSGGGHAGLDTRTMLRSSGDRVGLRLDEGDAQRVWDAVCRSVADRLAERKVRRRCSPRA